MPWLARLIALALFALPAVAAAQGEAVPARLSAEAVPEALPEPTSSVDLEAVLRGEGRGLTAADAARIAVETSPSVERAQAAVRQAAAGADRALYGFIPQLALSLRYTRLSEIQQASFSLGGPMIDPEVIPGIVEPIQDPVARELWRNLLTAQAESSSFQFPILLDQYSVRATLTYPLSDVLFSIWPAYEGAQDNAEALRLREQAQREDVALSAREAFYDYARARGALAVARISVEQAEARHQQVQAFVAAGTAAAVDELRIRAQLAAARVTVARAEGGVTLAAMALGTLLHLPAGASIAVGEDVLAAPPAEPAPAPRLIERALQRRTDLRALRRLVLAAGHQVDAAEGTRYPHLALQANLDVANPNPRVFPQTDSFRESWDVSAVLSWSLHDTLNGEQQANEARAQQDQMRADVRALEDAVRVQVVEARTSYLAAREALEAAHLGVEAAEESYRVQMERYQAGASTVSEVIDASAEQLRAQLDLVNSAIDARVAWARLERRVGADE